MKRALSNDTQNSSKTPNLQCSGRLILSISNSGAVVKFRRVEVSSTNNSPAAPHPNCISLPNELYKSIIEYSVQNMPDRSKLLSLLKANTVSRSFYVTINQIIEQLLRSSTADTLAILLGQMLNTGAWFTPAVYYSFATRWLSADTCPNTEGARNLSRICSVVSSAFETKIISLAKLDSTIKKSHTGFDIEFDGRTIKFNESNASIHALNVFIQNYCLNMQVFKVRNFDQYSYIIDFLEKHNSKEHFSKIIGQQISFFCDQLLFNQAICSASFLIIILKRGLVSQENLLVLLRRAFDVLHNLKANVNDRIYTLRLLNQVLKMNLIKFDPYTVQILKSFAFAMFAAPIDPMLPVQKQDAAMGLIQELIAAGYTLNLRSSEMKILKDHAIERLAYQYGDLDFKHDIIELLGFVTQIEEWFSLLSVPLFECVHKQLIIRNPQHSPSQSQRLLRMYDILLKHPEEKIRFLATEIIIFIKSGAPALKSHVLSMLQESDSPITRNRKLSSLEVFLKADSLKLEESETQMIKDFVFSDISTLLDTPNSIQKNDPAALILKPLLALDHSLVLSKSELEALKTYATEQFKDDSVDLLLKQNLIELLLDFIPEPTELFPIVSLKFFENVKNVILSNKMTYYSPPVAKKLAKVYETFLDHPNPQLAFLAAEISLLIDGILPD